MYVFIARISAGLLNVKKECYVISVEKKSGERVYLRVMGSTSTRSASNNGLVDDPAHARQFDVDVDKEDIIYWMDVERPKITKWANVDTMMIELYECTTTPIDAEDLDWKTALQRTAMEKLSVLQIEALGLEKYEIERRLSK